MYDGYVHHDNFRIGNIDTYYEVIRAAFQYRKDTGTMCDYPCRLPEFGYVRVNPVKMLEYYNKTIAQA